jgi:hypothetical protein
VSIVVSDEEKVESEFFDLPPALDESGERRIRNIKNAEAELGHKPSSHPGAPSYA